MTSETARVVWTAACVGGPLDGQELVTRCPKGVLLVDRPAGRCWIYELHLDDSGHPRLVARDPNPMPLLEQGPKNRHRAAGEPNYDVVAAPWAGAA